MYLESIEGKLLGQRIHIKYDCDGGYKNCGKEHSPIFSVAQKNFDANDGKHICRSCVLKAQNPMKRKEVKEKIKKTNLELYGVSMPMNTKDKIQKRKEQFKDEEFKKQWVEKHKKTNLEKYGVEHPMMLETTKEKQKETMQEKYGVDYPYQSEEIMAKMKADNKEKYGVENVASLPEVQIKMAKTILERYGVEHYNQLPEMKDYLRENCKDWLADSYANPWVKGITRPEEWNQKQRETITELMQLGIWKAGYPRSKKGFCYPKKCKKDKVYFRSSYEAIYCYYLDNLKDVEWFNFEGFRIEYEFENKKRYYVPDFLVKWNGKNKLSIKELKAEFMKDDEQVTAKTKFAEIFAVNNEMDFEILCCKEIKSLNIEFDFLVKIGFAEPEKKNAD